MGVVALANGLVGGAGVDDLALANSVLSWLPDNFFGWLILLAMLGGMAAFAIQSSHRLLEAFQKVAFSNWRLALLGVTGVVLSLASGWTTWDGMRNFTGEPVLSFMVTFGIQGVMLIVAWLIGETFATGMSSLRGHQGGVLSVAYGLVAPYFLTVRIILTNIVLWIMFLACMATSVFFSFDSLFSTIFPQEERIRAAQLRAQNQISGLVSELGDSVATERLRQGQLLFQTEAWTTYSEGLDLVAQKALAAQDDLKQHFQDRIEKNRRSVAEQQERRSTAESQQAALRARKTRIAEELSRLQAARPGVVGEITAQEEAIREIERRLEQQKAAVLAEEKGVGDTRRAGRGQKWRAQKALEEQVAAEFEIASGQLRTRQQRLTDIDSGIAAIKSELATLDGELAKLSGEALTAGELIAAADAAKAADAHRIADPINILPTFERARTDFREEPTSAALEKLQGSCLEVLAGLAATGTEKGRNSDSTCDAKVIAELAEPLFALNRGLATYRSQCASGESIEAQGSTNNLFQFLRKCLANSGLPSEQTSELRNKINLAELNRDDRAHRFVVTWNAFTDGNRLAYLALAIAIAIDSLVFMAGLFGANVVRSPLQDVPNRKSRSARHLEEIVDNALLPNRYASACATLNAMHPVESKDGFTQEILLSLVPTSQRDKVKQVLNAGAAIGAVQRIEGDSGRARVRAELFEYLSIVAKREVEANDDHTVVARLEPAIAHALEPRIGENAKIVLRNLTPFTPSKDERRRDRELRDYSARLSMPDSVEDLPVLNNFLITGAAENMIRDGEVAADVAANGGNGNGQERKPATETAPVANEGAPVADDGDPQEAAVSAEANGGRPRAVTVSSYLIHRLLHKALLGVARSHPVHAGLARGAAATAAETRTLNGVSLPPNGGSLITFMAHDLQPVSLKTTGLHLPPPTVAVAGVTAPEGSPIRKTAAIVGAADNDQAPPDAHAPVPPDGHARSAAGAEKTRPDGEAVDGLQAANAVPAPMPLPAANPSPASAAPYHSDATPPADTANVNGAHGANGVAAAATAREGRAIEVALYDDDAEALDIKLPEIAPRAQRAEPAPKPAPTIAEDSGIRAPDGVRPDVVADADADIHALETALLEHYGGILGFPPETIRTIGTFGQRIDVEELNQAMDAVLAREDYLKGMVAAADRNVSEAVKKAGAQVPPHIRQLAGAEDGIDWMTENLIAWRIMFLLVPTGAYRNHVWQLRTNLADQPGTERKRSALQKHHAELGRANIESEDGWDEIKHSLGTFAETLAELDETDLATSQLIGVNRPAER